MMIITIRMIHASLLTVMVDHPFDSGLDFPRGTARWALTIPISPALGLTP